MTLASVDRRRMWVLIGIFVLALVLAMAASPRTAHAYTITVITENKLMSGFGYAFLWNREIMVYGPNGYYRYKKFPADGRNILNDTAYFYDAPAGNYRIWVKWTNCIAGWNVHFENNKYPYINWWTSKTVRIAPYEVHSGRY